MGKLWKINVKTEEIRKKKASDTAGWSLVLGRAYGGAWSEFPGVHILKVTVSSFFIPLNYYLKWYLNKISRQKSANTVR